LQERTRGWSGHKIIYLNQTSTSSNFKFHNRCCKNQAEHLATFKILEKIEKSPIKENIPRTGTVHTDSRFTNKTLKITKIPVIL